MGRSMNSTWFTSEKIAVLTPIARPSVSVAMIVC